MNRYVLIISVGPVQGFIAAARRSRDLWSGSWLLSEMSKAVAKYLADQKNKVELIFPYTEQPEIDLKADSDFSVGNKIQVVVEAENTEKVKEIAKGASDEAKKCFQEIATVAFAGLSRRHLLRKNIWDEQLGDYVETQAAWAKIIDGQYHRASKNAAKVLAARKATRNFGQTAAHALDRAFMVPKSSLDGARETILPEEGNIAFGLRSQLGLSDSEQLDCAGVTKRLGGETEQFTPFTRVAAHFWIQETLTDQQRQVIRQAYKPLVGDLKLATEVKGNTDDSGKSIYSDLPFDAQLLYPARLEVTLVSTKKKAKDDPDAKQAYDALVEFKQTLEKAEVWKTSQPCSYGVLLLADGDRMGELLDAAQSEKEHQSITQALSEFASSVADIMRTYSGHCIYAGGDDVLGLVPLNTAYECARDLSQTFKEKMQVALQKLNQAQSVKNAPTLSVGLAIAHHMTPLGIIRELAKQAEGIAKGNSEPLEQQRNALGITLAVRSGAATNIRLPWTDADGKEHSSQKALELWQKAYREKAIPSRIAYDAQAIHLRTKFALDHDVGSKIQLAEFKLMLDRAKTQVGNKIEKKYQDGLEARFDELKNLEKLANELIVARWLAAKTARDISMES